MPTAPLPCPALPAGLDARRLLARGVTLPLSLGDFKLIAFDMDSTLISIECVDEIADAAGRRAEVATITEAAMRGEIADYKASLRQRVALLRGVPLSALRQVAEERLRVHDGARELVQACRAAGLKTLLVSGGFTWFSDRVRDALGLDAARSNVLELSTDPAQTGRADAEPALTGRLLEQPWGDIVDGEEKRRTVLETVAALGGTGAQVIAVGDGANDLPMMAVAGLSVAYRAKPAVRAQADVAIEVERLDTLLALFGAGPR